MSFSFSRRRYHEDLRFRKGQRILCLPVVVEGGKYKQYSQSRWTPAIIEAVNYQHYNKINMVSKVFPYKVRFMEATSSGIPDFAHRMDDAEGEGAHRIRYMDPCPSFGLLEADEEDTSTELTPESFIQHDGLNNLSEYCDDVFCKMLEKIKGNDAEERVEELLLLAASLRRVKILDIITRERHLKAGDGCLGRKMLYRVIHSQEQYATLPPEGDNHPDQINQRYIMPHVENLDFLMNWLRYQWQTPVEEYRDEHDRHVEHIAVLRGDYVLLKWLLWDRWEYARVPEFRDMGCSLSKAELSASFEQRLGMPTDAYGWSPLHYLLFCYSEDCSKPQARVQGKLRLLMHLYHTIHYVGVEDWNIRTPCPQGFRAIDLLLDRELRSSQLETFGLSLTLCNGKYSRAPSEIELHEVAAQSLAFQRYIYQETIYDAVYGDTEKDYNYGMLQRLVEEQSLGIQPRGWDGVPIDPQVAVFKAAALGFSKRFKWLFESLNFASLDSIDNEGRNLMHVAAHFNQQIRDTQIRMASSTSEHRVFRRAQRAVEKLQLFKSYEGATCSSSPGEWLEYHRSRYVRRAMAEDVQKLLRGHEGRIEIVKMLYKFGMPLPTTRFCLNECDYPTAKFFLEKKIKYSRAIDEWFQDCAPVAMTLTKEYLWETVDGEVDETLVDMALLCLEKHAWDVEDLLEFSRLFLFQWLVEEMKVIDPLRYRFKNGETLLHLAVRNRQVMIVFWLCVNYGSLCHVAGGMRGQLPAHLSIETADDYDVSSLIVKAVIQYTGDYRPEVFLEGWGNDIRVWNLEDHRGVTLDNYAQNCKNATVRSAVEKNKMKKAFSEAVAQLDTCCFDDGDADEGLPFASPSSHLVSGVDNEIDPDDL